MYLETIYDVNVIRYITCIVWHPSLADILRKLVDINPKRRRRVRRVGHARRSSVTKKGSTPSTYSNQTPSTSNWIRTSRQTEKCRQYVRKGYSVHLAERVLLRLDIMIASIGRDN